MIIDDTPAYFTNNHAQAMLLRDYFAAKAMQTLMASFLGNELDLTDPLGWREGLAMDAYSIADIMMKERNKK